MKHADAVPYGWYELAGRNPWFNRATRTIDYPDTVSDPRNFVLTEQEVKEYHEHLQRLHTSLSEEMARVAYTHRAMTTHLTPSYINYQPQVLTLAHALQTEVVIGKGRLAIMEWLLGVGRRVNALRAEAKASDTAPAATERSSSDQR